MYLCFLLLAASLASAKSIYQAETRPPPVRAVDPAMPVHELQLELEKRGVRCEGCTEHAHYVHRLQEVWAAAAKDEDDHPAAARVLKKGSKEMEDLLASMGLKEPKLVPTKEKKREL